MLGGLLLPMNLISKAQLIKASYSKTRINTSTMKGIESTGSFIVLFNFTLCSTSTINAPFLARRPFHQIGLPTKESIEFLVDVNVIPTSVLDFAPWLELHHVVLVSEPESTLIYAIDYSPINQKENIMKLLFGQNVEAEIRVRTIKADDVNDIEEIKQRWSCLSCRDEKTKLSTVTINNINEENSQAKKFIKRIEKKWGNSMNLYTHNCQHFSNFVTDLMKEEEICFIESDKCDEFYCPI